MFHTCKTFLLAVTVDVVAASFAARSDLQGHSATQVMNSVGAMLEKRGMDAGVLGKVLAEQTPQDPKSEDALHEILSSVILEIETTVITKIKEGHESTQKAINSHIEALSQATAAAVKSKTDEADRLDGVWVACVRHEKSLRDKLMLAETSKISAQNEQGQTCEIKEKADIRGFSSTIAGDDLAFECDFGAGKDSDCSGAYINYQAEVNALFETLEFDVEDARADFQVAYDNCESAKTLSANKDQALKDAEASWQAQTEKCSSAQEDRTLSLCNFGALLQNKCERLDEYNILMTSIDEKQGGEYSFPDRVAEFLTAKVTNCMLSKLIAKEVIDEAAFESCHSSSTSAYSTEIGSLDRRETSLSTLVNENHFTCTESSIKFHNGKSWTVEYSPAIAPSTFTIFNYIEKESVTEQVSIKQGTDPFTLCAVETAP